MKNSELLDELRTNILHDRSDRTDGASDYLWTDATLYRYINEAQRRFARGSLCIRDADNPEVTEVILEEGEAKYALHPSILAVLSVRLADELTDMQRVNHELLSGYRRPDVTIFDASASSSNNKPQRFSCNDHLAKDDVDSSTRVVLRVDPAPSTDYAGTKMHLRVIRLPLETIDSKSANAYPEIPDIHHLEMLDWAAYLALRIVDIDAGAPDRAQEFKKSFNEHVAAARRAVIGKIFSPFAWGFGQGGYSWEK